MKKYDSETITTCIEPVCNNVIRYVPKWECRKFRWPFHKKCNPFRSYKFVGYKRKVERTCTARKCTSNTYPLYERRISCCTKGDLSKSGTTPIAPPSSGFPYDTGTTTYIKKDIK
jgi:hypothetical protein